MESPTEEVTLEQLEALINKDVTTSSKTATKEKTFDTNLSSLTAAMFGIAGTIGAGDEVSDYTLCLFQSLTSERR